MQVELITHTPNPEAVCAMAARMCYAAGMPHPPGWLTDDVADDKLPRRVIGMGHESVLEHASFTFTVDGISRARVYQ